jgi:hypothetical protein
MPLTSKKVNLGDARVKQNKDSSVNLSHPLSSLQCKIFTYLPCKSRYVILLSCSSFDSANASSVNCSHNLTLKEFIFVQVSKSLRIPSDFIEVQPLQLILFSSLQPRPRLTKIIKNTFFFVTLFLSLFF